VEQGTASTRLEPETSERFVPLRRQLGVSSFGINQLTLQPGQRSRIHRHENQEEVYVVLEGTLTLAVEAEETDFGPGELTRVAPSVRRQLINRGPERVVLIALGGHGEHQGRDAEAFESWDQEVGGSPRDVPFPPDLGQEELRTSV
jgi:mannose-6-phosphate isomerase-like protein (cupin superfamily)